MANLDTLKANLIKFKCQREQQKRLLPKPQALSDYNLDGPPDSLVALYCEVLDIKGRDIICDASFSRIQHCEMLGSYLMEFYNTQLTVNAISNRMSYWKPNVKMVRGDTIQVSLGDTVIATFR